MGEESEDAEFSLDVQTGHGDDGEDEGDEVKERVCGERIDG